MNKKIAILWLSLIATIASAATLSSASTSPDKPVIDQEFNMTLKFDVPNESIRCGLKVDWGDGEVSKFKVGIDQDLKPPFQLTHVYKKTGKVNISVSGATIFRGLNTVGSCDGSLQGVLTVIDPVEQERLAQEKAAADAEKAKKQAEFESRILAISKNWSWSAADCKKGNYIAFSKNESPGMLFYINGKSSPYTVKTDFEFTSIDDNTLKLVRKFYANEMIAGLTGDPDSITALMESRIETKSNNQILVTTTSKEIDLTALMQRKTYLDILRSPPKYTTKQENNTYTLCK